jgi:hypothetical protein
MRISKTILFLLCALTLSGCGAQNRGGFAIYLLAEGITPQQLPALSHLELADRPFLPEDDIVAYRENSHEMELTAEGMEKVRGLKVPVTGIAFAVCVDREPVYAGAFWSDYSSVGYDGVVIDIDSATMANPILRLQLGYPDSSFFRGDDPRSDPRILSALEKAGKLK